METFAERREAVHDLLHDSDLDLTPKEVVNYLYHWYKYEASLRKCEKARKNIKKFAAFLDEDTAAFKLRKTLNNL